MAITRVQSFTMRKAVLEDAAHVAKLGAATFSVTFGHSVTPQQLQMFLDEAYSVEATSKDISDPYKDMILAIGEDGSVIGFVLLNRSSSEPCVSHLHKTMELQRVYVDPNSQGSGIGKILLVGAEDMARQQGFENIWLGVWEENEKAQTVYGKLGYKFVGSHDFDIGGCTQTDLIMAKSLMQDT